MQTLSQKNTQLYNKISDDGWILCSVELPKDNKKKLVTYISVNARTGRRVGIDKYINHTIGNRDCSYWQGKGNRVIAWMPLPEIYIGDIDL